ncbi:hypothetical protein CVT26_007535 [Gymnopilus dilepis]|uniref:Uncharacterized protein n=1 Tax=Gymnopilus dilepis TaxID=231916 RepID=A0A409W853_9AGAR|nr:hypothetical protein CVT26_007535 [Gymnopilus dilepis]
MQLLHVAVERKLKKTQEDWDHIKYKPTSTYGSLKAAAKEARDRARRDYDDARAALNMAGQVQAVQQLLALQQAPTIGGNQGGAQNTSNTNLTVQTTPHTAFRTAIPIQMYGAGGINTSSNLRHKGVNEANVPASVQGRGDGPTQARSERQDSTRSGTRSKSQILIIAYAQGSYHAEAVGTHAITSTTAEMDLSSSESPNHDNPSNGAR